MLVIDIPYVSLETLIKQCASTMYYMDYIYVKLEEPDDNTRIKGLAHRLSDYLRHSGFDLFHQAIIPKDGKGPIVFIRKTTYFRHSYVEYEYNGELWFWEGIKNSCKTVFDVGARGSFYPLGDEEDRTYYLFDPKPAASQKLKETFSSRKNVHIIPKGLGAEEGMVNFDSNLESAFHVEKVDHQIPIIRMDTFVLENGIPRIDFLKIDTEGNDLNVLRGAEKVMDRIGTIQFEYVDTYKTPDMNLQKMYEYLHQHGFYYIYLLTEKAIQPRPYPLDQAVYANYIASRSPLCFHFQYTISPLNESS